MIERRLFLISAAGLLLGAGTAAAATPKLIISTEMINDPNIGRYAMTVKLQQDLYQQHDDWKAYTQTDGHNAAVAKDQLNSLRDKADELTNFLMTNFAFNITEETLYQIDDIWSRRLVADTMSEEGLRKFLDTVIPIVVMKNAISTKRVPFDVRRMAFEKFAERYKSVIMGEAALKRPDAQIVAMYPEWAEQNGLIRRGKA